jgi:hypothetical protein
LFPQVQNRCAAAALLITTLSSTSIISNRTSSLVNMSAFICKAKATLLDHMKTLPDAHIAAEVDFVAWGRQFIDAAVTHV